MAIEYDDLRGYIEVLEAADCLKKVENADWNIEIGAICEINSERKGNALLFDKIKGYPEGYRVLTNFIFQPKKVQRVAFGIPESMSDNDVILDWRDKLVNYKPVPPVVVDSGPIMENIQVDDDIDMFKFPAPFWHTHDGGRYIGTADLNINRDPDTGFVNIGTYRVMIHEKNILSYYMSPGAHGDIIREKYWSQGKDCPVVLCFGQDPMIFAASTMQIPWGQSEYDFAGYLKGRPVKVIIDDVTGLPIPANAEIAIVGFAPPPDKESRLEGPFGEWTGYYASEPFKRPYIHIKKVYHRNNPIITGAPLNKSEPAWYDIPIHYAPNIWERLLAFGMPGIKGVWSYGRGGRTIAVISIQQAYLGHARAVGTVAAMVPRGAAMSGKYTIVVDDDIDPSNWDEVVWALSSRVDPDTQIDILRGHLNTPLDPAVPPDKRSRQDYTMGRVVIDACRPFNWRHEYAEVISYPTDMKKQLCEKFAHLWQ